MKDIILVDNSPNSFLFQPENAYHISNFFDDKQDRDLVKLACFLEKINEGDDVRPIGDLRMKYESEKSFNDDTINRMMKSVKIKPELVDLQSSPTKSNKNANLNTEESLNESFKKEDKEEYFIHETEQDKRKNDREEEFQTFRFNETSVKKDVIDYEVAPLTKRTLSNDKLPGQFLDYSFEIEPPLSSKESDALVTRQGDNDASFDKDFGKTHVNDRNRSISNKSKLPLLLKSHSKQLINLIQDSNFITVEDPSLKGHNVEEIRFHTGIDNLNSPLGRHLKFEYNNSPTEVGI
jgi:hypothetical protein